MKLEIFFEAAGVIAKIVLSLKSNRQIKLSLSKYLILIVDIHIFMSQKFPSILLKEWSTKNIIQQKYFITLEKILTGLSHLNVQTNVDEHFPQLISSFVDVLSQKNGTDLSRE